MVVFTSPLVGSMEEIVGALVVRLVTVNWLLYAYHWPSGFVTTTLHTPASAPVIGGVQVIWLLLVAVPVQVIFVYPVRVRLTVVVPEGMKLEPVMVTATLEVFNPEFGAIPEMVGAPPPVPVAVKVTGDSEPLVAVRVLVPTVPRVQLPTVAIPFVPVVCEFPDTEPLPVAVEKITVTPLTGVPFTSFTITLGGTATVVPAVAD
jgi:hypothetical protein